MAAGHEITSYAAAPGYCAIVEWKEGAGGRLLQWFAGGTKFNPVFSVTDPTAAYGRCDGHAFGFSVFAYHSRKDSVVRAWVRGANNKWTAIDATEVAKG